MLGINKNFSLVDDFGYRWLFVSVETHPGILENLNYFFDFRKNKTVKCGVRNMY